MSQHNTIPPKASNGHKPKGRGKSVDKLCKTCVEAVKKGSGGRGKGVGECTRTTPPPVFKHNSDECQSRSFGSASDQVITTFIAGGVSLSEG